MPSIAPRRRGNPYRNLNGMFCSRREHEAIARGRIIGYGGWGLSCYVREVMDPSYVMPDHMRRARVAVTDNQMLSLSSDISELRYQLDATSNILSDLRLAAPERREGRGGCLTGVSNNNVMRIRGNLESVLEMHNLRLFRVTPRNGSQEYLYWVEVPGGNRFALRARTLSTLLDLMRSTDPGVTDAELYGHLDDLAWEVDFVEDRLQNLLEEASNLGIPGYEQGSDRDVSVFNYDDVCAMERWVTEWRRRSDETRNQFAGSSASGCLCPECRFVAYEINYGQMLQARYTLDGSIASAITIDTFENTSYSAEVRRPDLSSFIEDEPVNTPMPRRLRSLFDRIDSRAAGYYNDYGDWVEGRRPAAETRRIETTRGYEADGFLSPENFNESEDDWEEGGYSYANRFGIREWNYRAPVEMQGKSAFGTFFGIELEINAQYQTATIPNAVPYIGSVKWDGSVSSGYEIVTQPMSLDFAMEQSFSWIPALREAGARAGRNGLHCHISRAGFASDWHRYKFITLWMEPSNYIEVKAFNRRHCGEYASPNSRMTNYQKARRIAANDDTRYCLVNTTNEQTIEMRGPASTLNRIKLKGTICGFAAAVEYTRAMSGQQVALGGLQWSGFVQWASERPEYSAFIIYLDLLVTEGAPASVRAAQMFAGV